MYPLVFSKTTGAVVTNGRWLGQSFDALYSLLQADLVGNKLCTGEDFPVFLQHLSDFSFEDYPAESLVFKSETSLSFADLHSLVMFVAVKGSCLLEYDGQQYPLLEKQVAIIPATMCEFSVLPSPSGVEILKRII